MYILFFTLLVIIGVVWLYKGFGDIKQYNKKLFLRTWQHERFLMEIYADAPTDIQDRIEEYLNTIAPL
jgi:hypothetical protein